MKLLPIIEVSQQNFNLEVLRRSLDVPVLVDFWAEWCGPCRALSPILEKLAAAYAGRWQLAKCDIESNKELAKTYQVKGIPNCKLFIDGALVDEFQGVKSERDIRQFLDKYCSSQAMQVLDTVKQHLAQGEPVAALDLLEAVKQEFEDQESLNILLVRTLLQLHDFARAQQVLRSVPEHHPEFKSLQQMINFAQSAAAYGTIAECEQRAQANPRDLEARYQWGIVLSLDDRYEEAMDRFLEIIGKDKNFGEGKVRQSMLTLFEVLGQEHELTASYRRKMANLIL